jgi:hypothetical protein
MEDNIQEMYKKARKAFREVENWPQEKVDEMVQAVAWELPTSATPRIRSIKSRIKPWVRCGTCGKPKPAV